MKHPSHRTRVSDASSFDEICVNCGARDESGVGWGTLAEPCTNPQHFYVSYIVKDPVCGEDRLEGKIIQGYNLDRLQTFKVWQKEEENNEGDDIVPVFWRKLDE